MDENADTTSTTAQRSNESDPFHFARRVLIAASVTVAVLLGVWLLGHAAEVFLLIFAGILLAVFLRALSDSLVRVTSLPDKLALFLVILVLGVVLGLGGWLMAPALVRDIADLTRAIPETFQSWREYIRSQEWGKRLMEQTPGLGQFLPGIREALTRGVGLFSTWLGWVINVVVILFLGLFFSYKPSVYLNGLTHLVPIPHRPRVREVLGILGRTLRRWLVGRAVTMIEVALLTWLGLWLLGIPHALTLALLVGICSFVPNFGPILATLPILCLAWTVSPMHVLYALILQIVIGLLDGYVFTPLVTQQAVGMPPAFVISAQVLMGVLLGGLGVALATPLVAVTIVLVRELYVRDTLGDEIAPSRTANKKTQEPQRTQ